jgi:hypothetical protein
MACVRAPLNLPPTLEQKEMASAIDEGGMATRDGLSHVPPHGHRNRNVLLPVLELDIDGDVL